MAQAQGKAITVINPAPTFGVIPGAAEEMISTDVSLDTLKANIKELISECQEMFQDAAQPSADARIAHVDLSLAISVDGSVGLFGTAGGAEPGGGITVRLEFSQGAQGTSVH
ncbi:MAG: hypothetical protein QOK44_3567 [Betaproteobacteria bacterium]|jgi:hypothetical protein|nr:hypothetical protein [Betaproteobacteria bacterium]